MGCDQCHNHPSKLSIMWHIICAHAPTITAAGLMMIVWLYLLTLILYGMWLANPEVAKHREWQFVSGQIIGGKNEQGKISWSHQRHLFCYQKGSSLNRRVAITFPNSINISVDVFNASKANIILAIPWFWVKRGRGWKHHSLTEISYSVGETLFSGLRLNPA